jgi:predicted transglutaminase-like cysteine proteinase
MPRNLALKRGLRLPLLIAGIIGCLLGDWQAIALRLPDLSPSQNVALRFPELSPSQSVALRFPELSPSRSVALRFPELSPSQNVALRFPEASAVGVPLAPNSTAATALAPPAPLVHLIDFQVASALPPIGHSRFCLRYPDDCKVHVIDFRHRNIVLTPERWNELNIINRDVNRSIFAEVTPGSGATEEWVISPPTGDCKDYAVTKRHELLARGWPSRALLLSEVVIPSGEHHLILVVRVKDADLVLDNLNDHIRLAAMTYDQYLWVRIQSPQDPKFWMRVRRQDAVQTAQLSN